MLRAAFGDSSRLIPTVDEAARARATLASRETDSPTDGPAAGRCGPAGISFWTTTTRRGGSDVTVAVLTVAVGRSAPGASSSAAGAAAAATAPAVSVDAGGRFQSKVGDGKTGSSSRVGAGCGGRGGRDAQQICRLRLVLLVLLLLLLLLLVVVMVVVVMRMMMVRLVLVL